MTLLAESKVQIYSQLPCRNLDIHPVVPLLTLLHWRQQYKLASCTSVHSP